MICKFENVANTFLRKVNKFEGNGFLFWSNEALNWIYVETPLPPPRA